MAYLGNPGSTGQVLTAAGGVPAWSNPGWFTAYEIDFTAQTPATYTANGTYTIGGQSWVLSGYDAAVTTDLSAANGLRVQVPSGASPSITPLFNSPAINTLASPNVATRDEMLIWMRSETYTGTSGSGLSYADILIDGYYRATASTTFFARHLWQSAGLGGGVAGEQYAPFVISSGVAYPSSAYSTYTTSNMSHDVKVLRLRDNGRMDIWSGSWAAGWPSFASLQYRGFAQVSTASAGSANGTLWYPADVNLAIRAGTELGVIGIAGIRLKALRIQAR